MDGPGLADAARSCPLPRLLLPLQQDSVLDLHHWRGAGAHTTHAGDRCAPLCCAVLAGAPGLPPGTRCARGGGCPGSESPAPCVPRRLLGCGWLGRQGHCACRLCAAARSSPCVPPCLSLSHHLHLHQTCIHAPTRTSPARPPTHHPPTRSSHPGLNRELGLSDELFALADTALLTVLGQVAFMPLLVLAARVCPEVRSAGRLAGGWGWGRGLQLQAARTRSACPVDAPPARPPACSPRHPASPTLASPTLASPARLPRRAWRPLCLPR